MKKAVIIVCLLFIVFFDLQAQTVNDVPIKDIDVEYVQIVGTSRILSNKITVEIDFGQENKLFADKDTRVKDANGKNMIFNSMVDALNFMTKNGYEFVQAYALNMGGNQNIYHYLLRKKK